MKSPLIPDSENPKWIIAKIILEAIGSGRHVDKCERACLLVSGGGGYITSISPNPNKFTADGYFLDTNWTPFWFWKRCWNRC